MSFMSTVLRLKKRHILYKTNREDIKDRQAVISYWGALMKN